MSGSSLIIGDIDNTSFITALASPAQSPQSETTGNNDANAVSQAQGGDEGFKTPQKKLYGDEFKFDDSSQTQNGFTPQGEDNYENGDHAYIHTPLMKEYDPASPGRSLPMDIIDAHASDDDNDGMVSPLAPQSCAEDSIFSVQNQIAIDHHLRFMNELVNVCFVYIKPNANTSEVRDLVHDTLLDYINPYDDGSGRIIAEYNISSEIIQQRRLVDLQFRTLSRHAMEVSGANVRISSSAFEHAFGEELQLVKREKRIFNAREALSALACDPLGLEQAWREAEEDSSKGKIRCFGDDLFCGNLYLNGQNVYVINGFYMATRNEYVKAETSIHAYVIQWSPEFLSWKDFMSKVIGAEDPTRAEFGSLRQIIHSKYKELHLDSVPTEIHNVIHASASPLEGLSERMNWCSKKVHQDEYGRILLGRGIPESHINNWISGIEVADAENTGKITSIFNIVKYTDAKECAEKLTNIYDVELFGTSQKESPKGGCCTIS